MDNIKWIKISTGLFDDEKIKLIEKLPEADTIIVIWVYLLIQAGKVNDGGKVYLGDHIPYDAEMLATVTNRPVNTVRLALATFQKFKMVEEIEDGLYITNWEKHQNVEGLDRVRQLTRQRTAKYREKLKFVSNSQIMLPMRDVTLRHCDDADIDIDKNKKEIIDKKEIEDDRSSSSPENNEFSDILLLYEENIGEIKNGQKEIIALACEKYSNIWVTDAILRAMEKPSAKRNWEYIAGMLRNWEKEGHVIDTQKTEIDSVLPPDMLTPSCTVERAIQFVERKQECSETNRRILKAELIKRGIPFNELPEAV